MSAQSAFAQALLDPALPCPDGLSTWNGSDPAMRFAVYRNNVMVSLMDALADTYPVVQALVGEDFFRAMARVFAQANAPRSAVMAFYGRDFADFIDTFAPAASVPYLADVARLEMARVLAYHAADVPALDAQALQIALADPHRLAWARLALHPSVQVITSPFAVLSIWAAHQGESEPSTFDPDSAQTVLVFRNDLAVDMQVLADSAAQFVRALQHGQTLLAAAVQAADLDATFDLTHTLALLLRWQLVTHVTTGDPRHEHTH